MAQIKPNTLRKKILKQNKVLISYITNKGREIEAWGIKTIKGRVWKKNKKRKQQVTKNMIHKFDYTEKREKVAVWCYQIHK